MGSFKNRLIYLVVSVAFALLFLWFVLARPSFANLAAGVKTVPINVQRLKDTVTFLSTTALPRDGQHPVNLNKIAGHLNDEFAKYSEQVSFQKFIVGGIEYKNIIANFGPDTPDVTVIGAHYDAYSTHPAADDNGSGVAALLELARLLQDAPLKHRVILAAYTLEEPPYFGTHNMGSYIHASSLHSQGKQVDIMIAFDMLGYYSDEPGSQEFPLKILKLFYPTRGNFIAIVDQLTTNDAAPLKSAINQYTDLPAYSINAPRAIPGIDFSDHRNFWDFGYPALEVTDTSFYRNHAYHQEGDTREKLNYDNIAKVTYGVFKYLENR